MEEAVSKKKKKKINPSKMFELYRQPKVISKMAELKAMGLSDSEISTELEKEYGISPNQTIVKKIIQSYSIRGSEFLDKDKEISDVYKALLFELISECRDNIKTMRDAKGILKTRMNLYNVATVVGEEQDTTKKLIFYIKEIESSIRTQNDTIRTAKSILDVLSTHKKEVSVNQIGSVRSILGQLTELENAGYITINPEYRDSDVFKSLDTSDDELNENK
jgi:hypothetical protein